MIFNNKYQIVKLLINILNILIDLKFDKYPDISKVFLNVIVIFDIKTKIKYIFKILYC